jgi:predicted permease
MRCWRRRKRRDHDLERELRSDLELEAAEQRENGLSPEEARYAARRAFGNTTLVKEDARATSTWIWLETMWKDMRYAARRLRKNPTFTAVAVLSLALGIGANTAIFSLVDTVLLRVLPVRQPDSLVIVRALTRQHTRDSFSHMDYQWIDEHNKVFAGLAAFADWNLSRDLDDHKEKLKGELVSGNYFSVLGIEPEIGRMLAPEDDAAPGQHLVAVIGYAYWQRAFGGSPSVLGERMKFGNTALEIVGVVARNFSGESAGYAPDVWTPLAMQPQLNGGRSFLHTRDVSWLNCVGRLAPGVSLSRAQASMRVLLTNLRTALHADPQNDYLGSITVEPGAGGLSWLRDQYSQPLWILMALVALLLVIACANVANLLLARSATRSREFAVRIAIGAGRSRLIRQLLTEAALLAAIACVLGVGIALILIRALLVIAQIDSLDVHLNLKVLAFAIVVSCAAALAFGLAPAIASNRVDPWSTLKLGGRSLAISLLKLSPSRLLVISQTAISLVLLVASGLLLRTFLNLKVLNPGFDEKHVIEAAIDTSNTNMDGDALRAKLAERLSGVGGLQFVSFSQFGFGEGTNRICCIDVEGYTPHLNEDKNIRVQSVSPLYFATMDIPLLAGRDFTEADKERADHVAIINETMARYYFRDKNPVGKRFAWWPGKPKDIEIIGVVKDAKYDNLRQRTPRMAYLFLHGATSAVAQIRTDATANRPLSAVIRDCRAAIQIANSRPVIHDIEPVSAVVDRTLHSEQLVAELSTGFGALALLLTCIGLYGVLAYGVTRRTNEFGIRLALGAQRRDVLRMVMNGGLALVMIGIVIGLSMAYLLSGVLKALLYGVQRRDPTTFAIAACILIVVGAAAIYGPARRATKVDPTVALRYE